MPDSLYKFKYTFIINTVFRISLCERRAICRKPQRHWGGVYCFCIRFRYNVIVSCKYFVQSILWYCMEMSGNDRKKYGLMFALHKSSSFVFGSEKCYRVTKHFSNEKPNVGSNFRNIIARIFAGLKSSCNLWIGVERSLSVCLTSKFWLTFAFKFCSLSPHKPHLNQANLLSAFFVRQLWMSDSHYARRHGRHLLIVDLGVRNVSCVKMRLFWMQQLRKISPRTYRYGPTCTIGKYAAMISRNDEDYCLFM